MRRRPSDGTWMGRWCSSLASSPRPRASCCSTSWRSRPRVGTGPGEVDPFCALVRLVRCERGEARVRARVDARPDYGRQQPVWTEDRGFFTAEIPGSRLWISSDRELSATADGLEAPFLLSEGDAAAFALRYSGDPTSPISVARAQELLEITCS